MFSNRSNQMRRRRADDQKHRRRLLRRPLCFEPLEERVCLSLFLANYFGSEVLEFDETTGATIGLFGEANNTDSGLEFPVGLLFGPDGNLYVTNEGLNTISRFDGQTGASLGDFGQANNAESGLKFPNGLIFGPDGDLFVSSAGHGMTSSTSPMGAVLRFDGTTGAFEGIFGQANFTDSPLRVPIGLTFGPDGDLYVASAGGLPNNIDPDFSAILRYDGSTGAFLGTFGDADNAGSGLVRPQALTFGPDGNLYVSSTHTDEVLKYDGTTGASLGVFGEANNSDSGLTGTEGLIFGPGGDLFVVRSRFNILFAPPGGVTPPPANSEDVLRYDGQTGQFLGVFAADAGLDLPTHIAFTHTNPTTRAYENPDVDSTPGLFDPASGKFFLKNSNTAGVGDLVFRYGPAGAGWTPLVGDWDGNPTQTPGLFDPASGKFFLKNSNAAGAGDVVFRYGPAGAGWTPVVGDWDGDGDDTAGLFDPASGTFFLKNENTAGTGDVVFRFGPAGAGWTPLVGDWDGDGDDTVGLFDPVRGTFFLKNDNTAGTGDVVFRFGPAGAGWTPLVGDWDGNGTDTAGLHDPASGKFFLKNSNTAGVGDLVFRYGPAGAGWLPLAGNWQGSASPAASAEIVVAEQAAPLAARVVDLSGVTSIATEDLRSDALGLDAVKQGLTQRDVNTVPSSSAGEVALLTHGSVVAISSPLPSIVESDFHDASADRPPFQAVVDEALVELAQAGAIGIESHLPES